LNLIDSIILFPFFKDVNDSNERPESNLAFVRRKCDEWLIHGLPKLAQLQNYQFQIDERDLKIEKEWQPFLNDQARSVSQSLNSCHLSLFGISLHSIYLCACITYQRISDENLSYLLRRFLFLYIYMSSLGIL
jgi:hypothetical protein